MEDRSSNYIEDNNRESLIKHWELRLSDSLEAVRVAQRSLDTLYRQRYALPKEIGSTAISEQLSEHKEAA